MQKSWPAGVLQPQVAQLTLTTMSSLASPRPPSSPPAGGRPLRRVVALVHVRLGPDQVGDLPHAGAQALLAQPHAVALIAQMDSHVAVVAVAHLS